MRECPECARCYDDGVKNCPADGEKTLFGFSGEPLLKDRYLLEKRIGSGGMGKVYLARHLFLKTTYAIKVILPQNLGDDPELTKRFRQEAIATAAIRHPNIVAVTDFDVINDEVPFLVMEYVKGRSLDNLITVEGALPLPQVLEIMKALCSGVAAAHVKGIIHRDLKPLNILLENDVPIKYGLKILDFGLAKIRRDDMVGSLMLARTTGVVGSPYYMAPEQWSEEEADTRTDIYALGVILYQMLSGIVPFKGPSIMSVMKQHLFSVPPTFASIGQPLPAGLEAIVGRALAKERDLRPATVGEFWQEIEAAARPQLSATQYTPPKKADLGMATLVDSAHATPAAPTPQTAPTVLENIAEILPDLPSSGNYNRADQATDALPPLTNIMGQPPQPTSVPPQSLRTSWPSQPPQPPNIAARQDLDETLVRATGSLPPAPPPQRPVTTHKLAPNPADSNPPSVVRMTLSLENPTTLPPQAPVVTLPPTPPVAPTNPPAQKSRLGLFIGAGAAGLVLLAALGFGLSQFLAKPSAPTPANAGGDKVGSAMSDQGRTLVLDYYVQIKEGAKIPETQPLKPGQEVKLHFISRERGYVYILVHQSDGSLETFLTGKPAAGTKLTDNRLEAGQDFVFPGENVHITLFPVAGQAEARYTYTVLFSSQPLSDYSFFETSELRPLTPAEKEQVENLRKQTIAQGDVTEITTSATNKWLRNVSLPAQLNAAGKTYRRLVMFDISLKVQ